MVSVAVAMAGARPVGPHLAEALLVAVGVDVPVLDVAATGGDEEDRPVVLPAALEPVELRAVLRPALVERAAGVADRGDVRIRIVDVDPLDREPLTAPPALAQIDLRLPGDREHLQAPAGQEVLRVVGDVAVEAGAQSRARILRLVHDAG